MTAFRYKGFNILAWPYQLHHSKRWTVEQLKGKPWAWSEVVNALQGVFMRQGRMAGIVILCLGTFVLL